MLNQLSKFWQQFPRYETRTFHGNPIIKICIAGYEHMARAKAYNFKSGVQNSYKDTIRMRRAVCW